MARVKISFFLVLLFGSGLSASQEAKKSINKKRSLDDGWIGLPRPSSDYGSGQPWSVADENNAWPSNNKPSVPALHESHTEWNYGGIIKPTTPPPIIITKHVVVEKAVKVPPIVIEKKVPVEKIIRVPVEKLVVIVKPVPYPIEKYIPYPVIRSVAVPIPFVVTPRGLTPLTNFIQPAINADPAEEKLPGNYAGDLGGLEPQLSSNLDGTHGEGFALQDPQAINDYLHSDQQNHGQEYYKKKRSDVGQTEKTSVETNKDFKKS